MFGTGKCKGKGPGPGRKSLCLLRGPGVGVHREHVSRVSLFKNNHWREQGRGREVGAAAPTQLGFPMAFLQGRPQTPKSPPHGQRDSGRTQGSFYPVAVAQKKLNTFELPLAT